MKKIIWILGIIILVFLATFLIYRPSFNSIDNSLNQSNNLSQAVLDLNNYCPKDTFCVPFKPECGHWRITSYAPYKYCSIDGIDKNQCKFIENKEWATYCLALKASDDECLNFAENSKKLQAVCHINETNQFLFPRETFDKEVYVTEDENHTILVNPKFSIMANCSSMTAEGCNVIIWSE